MSGSATATEVGQPPNREGTVGRGWRARVPDVFARILVALALLCAVAAVSAALGARVQPARRTVDALLLPAPANLGYAAFVAMLAAGVHNRKRVAYWLLVVYFGLQLLFDAVFIGALANHDMEMPDVGRADTPWLVAGNTVLTFVALVVLLSSSQQFFARVQRASLRKALGILMGLLALFTVAGWLLVEAFPGSLRNQPTSEFLYAVREVTGGAFAFAVRRHGMAPGWVNLVLGLFGAVALFVAFFALLRAQRAAASMDSRDEQRIRELLAVHGEGDSLGYFATRRDKQIIFSPSGKAAVTYRVVIGVTLASGDPIGDPEGWGPAIDAWLQQAREYSWTPAVMGTSEDGATAYARAGLRAIELGDEAILHVDRFSLDGRDMRQVRQAVHRVRRAGYTVRIRRHAEIPPDEMAHIIELAARWRDTETERGFSMALGRLGDPADGRCALVEALDPDGREAALVSFTPWGRSGLSLDLMRRDRASDNGLVEYMVSTLMEQAPRFGVTRVSLNFAVFRSVFADGARIGAGPVLVAWRRLLLFLSRWFQLESLYRSNVKYHPEWVPRFLCFEDVRDLAKVGLASGIAEGFVPTLRTLLRRGAAQTAPASAPADGQEWVAPAESDEPVRPPGPEAERRLPEQVWVRLAKLDALRAAGVDPYPAGFARTHDCAAVGAAHRDLPPDTATGDKVAIAGRVVLLRDHGGLCFATVRDWSGDLQVMISRECLGAGSLGTWKSGVDLGDHVGVSGEVVTSRRGEVSVLADDWMITAKCLHPLPNKHSGLADREALVRQRHVDLIINPNARQLVQTRCAAVQALRTTLLQRGFLEVETPILHPVHGGANARPFATESNAHDMRLYLRIAPELYLKRLAVGGVEKLFELGRNFRNEGVDATHNPEFTMLEVYEAYGDYVTMRMLARDLVVAAATAAHGAPVALRDGELVDLDGPWPVRTVHEAVSAALGELIEPDTPVQRLVALADRAGVPVHPAWNAGQIVLELYERLVEARTAAPTFYTDFPTEVSPLTRAHREQPKLAERWDLVAFGMELGTAYTELTDPVEQRRRLVAQSLMAAGGQAEAMEIDEDFLATLEYAMPPTGGLGLGVDRLLMLITGRTIRETLLFPLVKPTGPGAPLAG